MLAALTSSCVPPSLPVFETMLPRWWVKEVTSFKFLPLMVIGGCCCYWWWW
ncbi:unnamed protein product [Heterobilharzia americana]|nr:unnamed protein product [Heterobilharzia americana]